MQDSVRIMVFLLQIFMTLCVTNMLKIIGRGFARGLDAGVRFGIGRKSKNLELRLSYMQGLKKADIISAYFSEKQANFGFAVLFNF